MPVNLAQQFLDTGILHFGLFQNGAETVPFRFEFDYLPAYPDVLRNLVSEARSCFENSPPYFSPLHSAKRPCGMGEGQGVRAGKFPVDRLIAAPAALPFGVALSQAANISLVYSRGRGEAAVHDLVGAYNSGHQALLLTNIFSDFHALNPLIADATRVGLEIRGVLALIDLGIENQPTERPLYRITRLADIVNDLRTSGLLPTRQAHSVLDWIDRAAANRRPTAAVP